MIELEMRSRRSDEKRINSVHELIHLDFRYDVIRKYDVIEREFDLLGELRQRNVAPQCSYTHGPDKLRMFQRHSTRRSYNISRPTSNESKVAMPKPPTGTGFQRTKLTTEEEHQKRFEKLSRHVSALLLLCNAHSSLSIWIYENVINNNKLKMHP